jgi:hypothetical protein
MWRRGKVEDVSCPGPVDREKPVLDEWIQKEPEEID